MKVRFAHVGMYLYVICYIITHYTQVEALHLDGLTVCTKLDQR